MGIAFAKLYVGFRAIDIVHDITTSVVKNFNSGRHLAEADKKDVGFEPELRPKRATWLSIAEEIADYMKTTLFCFVVLR